MNNNTTTFDPKQCKLVIFDWDGTLMDSTGKIVDSMQATALEAGLPKPPAESIRELIGLSLTVTWKRLFPDANEQQMQILPEMYRRQYVELNNTPSPLFAGARPLLDQLREQGMMLAVATGKARHGLQRVLGETGLEGHFIASKCADEAQSKPHPEMLELVLAETGVNARQALMVGDTSFDLEMARRAGMASVGVSFGAHSVERLRAEQPARIIDELEQLSSVLLA